MYSFIVAATCLVGVILAQTPPSYTLAETNNTLGLKYGKVNVIAGEVLGYEGESIKVKNCLMALISEPSALPRTSTQILDFP